VSLAVVEKRVQNLPKKEREPVDERIGRVADELLGRRKLLLRLETSAFEAFLRVLNEIIRNANSDSPRTTVVLPSELVGEEHEASAAELEKRNAELIHQRWAQAKRESFPSSKLKERLGVTRQRLSQMRQEGKLFGFKTPLDRELYYPAWQFGLDGEPVEEMPLILEAAREAGLDELSLHQFVVNEEATPAGSLASLLRNGKVEYVLQTIRAAGAHGA
jgi:hypothetical protein